jgi:hypothetical protein
VEHLGDAAARQSILERLERLRPDGRARWGRMSGPQMIGHLADSFRGVAGDKPVSPATGLFQRSVMKWFALYVPLPWPHGIPTRPEMDQHAGGTPPGDFEQDRAELVRLTGRFCDPACPLENFTHPIFGRMTRAEWLRWGYLHMDHHLRQFGV